MSVLRLCRHSLSASRSSPALPSTPFGEASEYVGEFMGESGCAPRTPGVWGKHIDAVGVLLLHFFRNAQERAGEGGRLSGATVANGEKKE